MKRELKPCPHCGGKLKIGHYSEDFASVTELHCDSEKCMPSKWHTRMVAQHYQGADDSRTNAAERYNDFINQWSV